MTDPVVQIVAHTTSPKQREAIHEQRVKIHATAGSVDVDDVEDLLGEAVDAGELVEAEEDVYRTSE